tara:strand:+ start:2753 stop:4204 length:1452 start_codon:yes stop_codon:yes gene_type:complete
MDPKSMIIEEYPPFSTPVLDLDNISFTPWRGVSEDTMRFYKITTTKVTEEITFNYPNGAQKIRKKLVKDFRSTGDMQHAGLFGKNLFSAGSAKAITITEGELDAASVYQMLGSKYPVVSIRSSSSAESDCRRDYDFLNSFSKIYLCLDSDKPGQDATEKIAKLFNLNKVFIVKLTKELKDGNSYLEADKSKDFINIWWNSKKYQPEGMYSSLDDLRGILRGSKEKKGLPYPFPTLNAMTYGIRKGEGVLFTALEGIGKTEVLRNIEYHILKTDPTAKLGIIHLEEDKERIVKGFIGLDMKVPVHLPGCPVSEEDQEKALVNLVKEDDRLNIYSHFGSDDPDVIIENIRYLVTVKGCDYIILDHITMIVTGLGDQDERKTLDYISTKLATLLHDLDFALLFVSHVNDDNKTRGSRNISKVANIWIHLQRDIEAEDEDSKNTTQLIIKKNRFGAMTGPAGKLFFNKKTFELTEIESKFPDNTIPF